MSNIQQQPQTNGGDNVALALSNPMVLEKILAETDNNSLYTSRLVSPSWNDAALSIFPKRPIKGQSSRALDLNKLFESSRTNPVEFDIRLLKSIKFSDNKGCISTASKFCEFWSQHSDQIEAVAFNVSDSFASTFSSILSNNLKVLSIKVYYQEDSEQEEQMLNLVPQISGMNLYTIEYHNAYSPTNFQAPIASIICQAVNLKRLKLSSHLIPDLSTNTKLRYLSFHYSGSAESYDHKKVSIMLEQVKDSLETLKLLTEGNEGTIFSNPKDFNIPRMPKLKKLMNNDISLQPLDNASSKPDSFKIIGAKFPAMKHLKIRDFESSQVQKLLDQLEQSEQRPQGQIVSLRLEKIQNPDILVNFKDWFANLKNIDLYMSRLIIPDLEATNRDPYLGSVFSKLKDLDLGLKKFIFRMDWKFKLSDLVEALTANAELFKGLSLLELHTKEHLLDSMVDDLGLTSLPSCNLRKLFCDWLVDITRTVNQVVFNGFFFSGETSWELIHFIRLNKLPVTFKNENHFY